MNKIVLLILILIVLSILCNCFLESFQANNSTTQALDRNYYEDKLIENVPNKDEKSIFLLKNDNNNTYLYYDNDIYGYSDLDNIDNIDAIDNKYKFKLEFYDSTRKTECDENDEGCDTKQFSIHPIVNNNNVYLTLWDNDITFQSKTYVTREKQKFNIYPPCTKTCLNGGKCVWVRTNKDCTKEKAKEMMVCDCNPRATGKNTSTDIDGNKCWYGATCGWSVDCPSINTLKSCNRVEWVKAGKERLKVCNYTANWPNNMCTKDYVPPLSLLGLLVGGGDSGHASGPR